MTWHVLLKALADTGRYDQVVKLLTDENADGPGADARPAGHVHVGAVEPGLRDDVAVQPDQQRVDVARLGRVGHRRHDRVAARHRGHQPRRGDGPDRPAGGRQGRPAAASAAPPGPSAARSTSPGARSTAPTCSTSTSRPTSRRRSRSRTRAARSTTSASARARRVKSASRTAAPCSRSARGATHFSIGADRRPAASAAPSRPRCRLTLGAPASVRRVHAGRRPRVHGDARPPTSSAPRATRR